MHYTTDLSIFQDHPLNPRSENEQNSKIIQNHRKELALSMQKNGFFKERPILVNKKMQVMDGTQRLSSAKMAGIGVWYEFFEGNPEQEAGRIKELQRAVMWKVNDNIQFGSALGHEGCKSIQDVCSKYKITFQVLCATLSINPGLIGKKISDLRYINDISKNESLLSDRLSLISEISEILNDYDPKSRFFTKKLSFSKSIVRFTQLTGFNRKVFIERCKNHTNKIKKRSSIDEYVIQFIEIYNFGAKSNLITIDEKVPATSAIRRGARLRAELQKL